MKTTTTSRAALCALAGVAVLGLVPAALAHGGGGSGEGMEMGEGMGMDHGGGESPAPKPSEDSYPQTYFLYPENQGLLYAHIALMVLSWAFVLPVAVMLSLARSRYTVPTQIIFTLANGAGVFFGLVYNTSTPDLYPGNAHHRLGWVVTWVSLAQVAIGVLGRLAGAFRRSSPTSRTAAAAERHQGGGGFVPVSTEAMAAHHRAGMGGGGGAAPYRLSHDSGQGTERNTESLRSSHSSSPSQRDEEMRAAIPLRAASRKEEEGDDEDDDSDEFEDEFLGGGGGGGLRSGHGRRRGGGVVEVARKAAGLIKSPRAWRVLIFGYDAVDRVILILGFIALCTGIIAQGRFFEGREIFSGLAHWIKGGVFFWLGILTLGRWCGAWAELGWAWNVRPLGRKQRQQKWRPSAEWVESFLILFYGSTNIFLEHLGGWGGAWSPQDLEHVSITVLFIGGGLCGMLIESASVRELLNVPVSRAATEAEAEADMQLHGGYVDDHHHQEHHHHHGKSVEEEEEEEQRRSRLLPPKQYGVSLNPIPALVILLLGIMMSSHTQTNMVSSMVHKQWGNLLMGGAVARGFSYVLVWLKPPRSVLPSRPPTELLAAFGLMAGGIIFMASSGDTVAGMIHMDMEAMFMYTVTMGLVGLVMAWVVTLMALKGWAVRTEAAAGRHRHGGGAYRPVV